MGRNLDFYVTLINVVWVDCDQSGNSIFLIFKYVDKQNVLITNIVSKVVTRLLYVFDFFFKLEVGVHHFRNYPVYVGFLNLW